MTHGIIHYKQRTSPISSYNMKAPMYHITSITTQHDLGSDGYNIAYRIFFEIRTGSPWLCRSPVHTFNLSDPTSQPYPHGTNTIRFSFHDTATTEMMATTIFPYNPLTSNPMTHSQYDSILSIATRTQSHILSLRLYDDKTSLSKPHDIPFQGRTRSQCTTNEANLGPLDTILMEHPILIPLTNFRINHHSLQHHLHPVFPPTSTLFLYRFRL